MNARDFPDLLFVSSKFDDGNMSFSFDTKEKVEKNRENFLKKRNLISKKLAVMQLEHKDNVLVISKGDLKKN